MRQTALYAGSFAKYTKQTKKEKFLLQMGQIILWKYRCPASDGG